VNWPPAFCSIKLDFNKFGFNVNHPLVHIEAYALYSFKNVRGKKRFSCQKTAKKWRQKIAKIREKSGAKIVQAWEESKCVSKKKLKRHDFC
jgi:hypothetical protein